MYLVGFAAAWWLARRRAAQPGSSWKAADVDDFLFYAMLGVILGGRIGYVLFYGLPLWRGDWLYPLKIWEGGMSFHGGTAWGTGGSLASSPASAAVTPWRCVRFRRAAARNRSVLRAHRQFHQRRAVGAADGRAVGNAGAGSERRSARRAPSFAAVRGDARRPGAVHDPVVFTQPAAAALCAVGTVSDLLFGGAHRWSNSCASPMWVSATWRSAG